MSGRVDSLALRLNYNNYFHKKNFYNFETVIDEYPQRLNRNLFIFYALQNELKFLRYKLFRVDIQDSSSGVLQLNLHVTNNFYKMHYLKFKKVVKLLRRFKTCYFFIFNARILKRTLKKLQKRNIKYSYKRGYRFHKLYFKKTDFGLASLSSRNITFSKTFKSFRWLKKIILQFFYFFSSKNNFLLFTKYGRLFFIYIFLTRLYYTEKYLSRFNSYPYKKYLKLKQIFFIIKPLYKACSKKKKLIRHFLSMSKNGFKFSKRFINVNKIKKINFKPARITKILGFFNKYSSKYLFYVRNNFDKVFIVYKKIIHKMFVQFYISRNVFVYFRLNDWFRKLFKKEVAINFFYLDVVQKNFFEQQKLKVPLLSLIDKPFLVETSNFCYNALGVILCKYKIIKKNIFLKLVNKLRKSIRFKENQKLYNKYSEYKKYYIYLLIALYQADAKLLNYVFCGIFRYVKHHKTFLFFFANQLEKFLASSLFSHRVSGLHIKVNGKINATDRTKSFYYSVGAPVKPQLIHNNISYNFSSVETYTGSFGIRVWIKPNFLF
jgi:hypothetical protein